MQELLDKEFDLFLRAVRIRAQGLDHIYTKISRTLNEPLTDAKDLSAAREYVFKVPVLVASQRATRDNLLNQYSLLDDFLKMYACSLIALSDT